MERGRERGREGGGDRDYTIGLMDPLVILKCTLKGILSKTVNLIYILDTFSRIMHM